MKFNKRLSDWGQGWAPFTGDTEGLRMSPDVFQDKAGTARLAFPCEFQQCAWALPLLKDSHSYCFFFFFFLTLNRFCQFLVLMSNLVPFSFTETMVSKQVCLVYEHWTDVEFYHVIKWWQVRLMGANWCHKHRRSMQSLPKCLLFS